MRCLTKNVLDAIPHEAYGLLFLTEQLSESHQVKCAESKEAQTLSLRCH